MDIEVRKALSTDADDFADFVLMSANGKGALILGRIIKNRTRDLKSIAFIAQKAGIFLLLSDI